MERYYENGKPRCQQKCVTRGVVCICEGVAGHEHDEHERIPTRFLATASDYQNFPVFDTFVARQISRR